MNLNYIGFTESVIKIVFESLRDARRYRAEGNEAEELRSFTAADTAYTVWVQAVEQIAKPGRNEDMIAIDRKAMAGALRDFSHDWRDL